MEIDLEVAVVSMAKMLISFSGEERALVEGVNGFPDSNRNYSKYENSSSLSLLPDRAACDSPAS